MTQNIWVFFFPFLSVSVHFCIDSNIRKRQEIQCLPYAKFLYEYFFVILAICQYSLTSIGLHMSYYHPI